jgi:Uma2 family endonuclease
MVTQPQALSPNSIIYPDSDGQPMADNTKQFRWIVTIKENLEILFADQADVFVAGDLLWYPVEGNNRLCQAPDVMVALGRPKGDRGSYQQWREANIAPQVVFEILSPSNSGLEMSRKLLFYQQYGVEEYYQYDPDHHDLVGSQRINGSLLAIPEMQGWVSPRLGIRFELAAETLIIYAPDGEPFLTPVELAQQRDLARQQVVHEQQRADAAQQQATAAQQQAEQEHQRAEAAQQRAAQLAAQLRALGVDPETL